MSNSIRLFDSSAQSFTTNGKGNLTKSAQSPHIISEVNGEYYLEMIYPCTGNHFNDIKIRDIIVSKPDPYSSPQAFRINSISLPMNGQVTIQANHISYDLSGVVLKAPPLPQTSTPDVPGSFNSCKEAFAYIKDENTCPSVNPFTFETDIDNSTRLDMASPMSVRAFLGSDNDNSIINMYGGELLFDNYKVIHKENIGSDSGVVVRYGKNLTDFKQTEDATEVATGVYPYYYQPNDGFIDGDVQYVLDDDGNKAFSYDKIAVLDCSSINWDDEGYSDYEGMPTKDMLNKYAKDYIINNSIGIPKKSTTISFKELARVSGGLSMIKELEKVRLGDWVTVLYPKINITLKAECVAIDYNAATDMYNSLTLGDPMETLSSNIVGNFFSQSNATSQAVKQITEKTTQDLSSKVNKLEIINSINNSPEKEKISPNAIDLDVYSKTEVDSKWDSHVNNTSNPHQVTKEQLGLSNVDNTADSEKTVKHAASADNDSKGNEISETYLKVSDAEKAYKKATDSSNIFADIVTLKSSDWADNAQEIYVSHVEETSILFFKSDDAAYSASGIKMKEQVPKKITFSCETVPEVDISVTVISIT